jgi:uncharacterized protein YcaQ
MTRPVLSNTAARRLFLARHGLTGTPAGEARGAALAQLIDDLGFVQIDSVNTLARAHDLILWSRRPQYRPAALGDLLARDRTVWEHWTHDASVLPIGAWRHWQHRFVRDRARLAPRWRDWQGVAFEDKFDTVLRRIADHGECTSGELAEGEARGSTGWWDWHPSKTALEYLWRTGEIAVTRREGFRKVYDLTERVIPDAHRLPAPPLEETVAWAAGTALDRLGFGTSREIAAFYDLITPEEAQDWARAALAAGEVVEVEVTCADGATRRSLARPATLAAQVPEVTDRVRVLSPFDPALRDRARAERLFGFHYRIEIFVPAAKRRYGYYVFPVLQGDRLIGRIDMKADRPAATLQVSAFWPEPGAVLTKARIRGLEAELARVAVLAGCSQTEMAPGWLR